MMKIGFFWGRVKNIESIVSEKIKIPVKCRRKFCIFFAA